MSCLCAHICTSLKWSRRGVGVFLMLLGHIISATWTVSVAHVLSDANAKPNCTRRANGSVGTETHRDGERESPRNKRNKATDQSVLSSIEVDFFFIFMLVFEQKKNRWKNMINGGKRCREKRDVERSLLMPLTQQAQIWCSGTIHTNTSIYPERGLLHWRHHHWHVYQHTHTHTPNSMVCHLLLFSSAQPHHSFFFHSTRYLRSILLYFLRIDCCTFVGFFISSVSS